MLWGDEGAMDMKKHSYKRSIVVVVGCGLGVWIGSGSDAANKTYEVRPQIEMGTGPYGSNTVMVLDAYERLMDNYMSLVQGNMVRMSEDVSQGRKQLGMIERKIDNLAVRMARIERALNLVPGPVPKEPVGEELY
jgi:hypothetical protein